MIKNKLTGILAIIFFSINLPVFATTTIKFATEATYPPFVSINPAGKIIGFDADIVHALCQQMQATCTLHNQPWESLIPSLKLGKFDALFGGMAITPEREKQVAFTNPYYQLTGSIIAPQSAHLQLTPESMAGKTIGVQAGTTYDTYLQATYGKDITINRYPSMEEALMDLTSGRVDAVMGDTPVMQQWLTQNGKNQYVTVGNPISDVKYFGLGDAIAVKINNASLQTALNKALAAIKADGTYCQIVHQYFGDSPCHG